MLKIDAQYVQQCEEKEADNESAIVHISKYYTSLQSSTPPHPHIQSNIHKANMVPPLPLAWHQLFKQKTVKYKLPVFLLSDITG